MRLMRTARAAKPPWDSGSRQRFRSPGRQRDGTYYVAATRISLGFDVLCFRRGEPLTENRRSELGRQWKPQAPEHGK